jgi:hypothetical protein
VLDDGAGIGGDDVFVLADADDQRASLAGDDKGIGLILADDGDAIGSLNLVQCGLDGALKKRDAGGGVVLGLQFGVDVADQDRQNFRIGLAGKGVAFFGEELLEGDVVFDDAVMDQGDLCPLSSTWGWALLRWGRRGLPSGCGPCRYWPGEGLAVAQAVFQDADSADGAADVQLALLSITAMPAES